MVFWKQSNATFRRGEGNSVTAIMSCYKRTSNFKVSILWIILECFAGGCGIVT